MASGRQKDLFAALVKTKIKEKHMTQRQVADQLHWSENKISCVINGKNYHNGSNQTGIYERTDEDCIKLASVLDPSPEFIAKLILSRNELVCWAMDLKGCDNLADVLIKAEEDEIEEFYDILYADEEPDDDE